MNKWLIGCLSLLAVCLVLLLTYMALMRMPNPRTKRIDLDDLMVTRADFPQGWGTSGGGPIPGRENQRGSEETLGRHWIPEGLSEWGGVSANLSVSQCIPSDRSLLYREYRFFQGTRRIILASSCILVIP